MPKHQGELLKKLIKVKGFTQAEFADKMEMARTNFSNYLNHYELKDPFIEKACNILGIKTDVFYESEKGGISNNKTNIGGSNKQVIGEDSSQASDNDCITQLAVAQKEIEFLNRLLAEKERTIELLSKR